MFSSSIFVATLLYWLSTLDSCQPIMVDFGVSKGPIIPKEIPSERPQPKSIVPRSPAPVREVREDVPNPFNYKAPIPHQYRTKIYSFKPSPNLILGTPLDRKYTPSEEKYNVYKKQYRAPIGLDYTGPHTFEPLYFVPKKTTLQPSVRYNKQNLQENQNNKYVPQIGVVYSSGVRYYVPQIIYEQRNGEEENSVYDKTDEKYYYYNAQQ
ncbi:uncharacterized protein LOC132696473 [Cylas formicarius]|uniref:uncharacterized protein LOC132696473 n=1 Tax=Cylas formicarius TaxID=197179 RepID=UPI00295849D5|nr:uncharacterized protein LOC132696473 [Cylas formicarius]